MAKKTEQKALEPKVLKQWNAENFVVEDLKHGGERCRLVINGEDVGVSFKNLRSAVRRMVRLTQPNRQPVAPLKVSADS